MTLKRFAKRALAGSAAAAALLPGAAHADEASFGGGAFIGYHFGPGSHLEWGIEGFVTRVHDDNSRCTNEERSGIGAFTQLSLLGLSDPRVTLAAHGGGEFTRGGLALTGELGATYRFGIEGGLGIHSGAMLETVLFNVATRYQWLLDEALVSAGARVLGTYGDYSMCSIGRPLRSNAGVYALHTPARSTRLCANAGQRIEAVGRAFEREAQLEHASVPAFMQLAAELSWLDAPATLVARALRAARDEQRHTALCLQLATRHLEDCTHLAPPRSVQRTPLLGRAGVVRLAVESWLDGCIAEGRAARHAARAAELATDPQARATQHTIALDEQRHAELAWSILQWALAAGGDEAREAVYALRDAGGNVAYEDDIPEGLQAHGRLGLATLHAVAAEHLAASHARLHSLLHAAV